MLFRTRKLRIGAEVDVPSADADGGIDWLAATLFGESALRVVVSAREDDVAGPPRRQRPPACLRAGLA